MVGQSSTVYFWIGVVAFMTMLIHFNNHCAVSALDFSNLGEMMKKIPGMENVKIPDMNNIKQNAQYQPQQQHQEPQQQHQQQTFSEVLPEQNQYNYGEQQQPYGEPEQAPAPESDGGINFAEMAKGMMCSTDADCANNQYMKHCHKFVCSFM